jgi:hypothetical protein
MNADIVPSYAVRRWVIRLVPVPVLAWCSWCIVVASGDRGAYYPHSLILADFHYPVGSVIVSLGLIAAEAFLVDRLLHRRGPPRLWPRTLILAICMLPISWCALLGSMHAPPYLSYHEAWLVFLNAFLLFVASLSVASHLTSIVAKRIRIRR